MKGVTLELLKNKSEWIFDQDHLEVQKIRLGPSKNFGIKIEAETRKTTFIPLKRSFRKNHSVTYQ
jgi:hypothetical protein